MWKLPNRRVSWVLVGMLVVLFTIYVHRTTTEYEVFKSPSILSNQSQETENGLVSASNQSVRGRSQQSSRKIGIHRDNEKRLPWWDGGECVCDTGADRCVPEIPSLETSRPPKLTTIGGTCGRRASADGVNQRVISFSLYGDDPGYWIGLSETLSKVRIWYPGWKVWLYTNPRGKSQILCPLLRHHGHFRVCDVTNLPYPLYNISNVAPTMWRISPLGDPLLDALMVRDSDSVFTEREKVAVDEWLESGKMFHVMRDHPGHNMHILCGMWGARWDLLIHPSNGNFSSLRRRRPFSPRLLTAEDLMKIRNKMLKMAYKNLYVGLDQIILKRELWPEMVGFVVSHDSFYCKQFHAGWRPWPTQRVNGTFVGNPKYRKIFSNGRLQEECPLACRPPDHPDWLFC